MEPRNFWIQYKNEEKDGDTPKDIAMLKFNSRESATKHIVNVLEKDEKHAGKQFKVVEAEFVVFESPLPPGTA